jgi:hypothetical protein
MISNSAKCNHLFQRVGYVRHEGQVTGFVQLGAALELEAGARDDTAGQEYGPAHSASVGVQILQSNILNTFLKRQYFATRVSCFVDTFTVGEAHRLNYWATASRCFRLSAGSSHCGGAGCTKQRACP